MSTQPKFTIYTCDTCDRETEIALDGNRPDPLRCNITLHCRGKLQRTGERSARKFLFTPLVAGLDDYIQRGTVISPPTAVVADDQFSIFTGESQITAACIRRTIGGGSSYFTIMTPQGDSIIMEIQLDTVTSTQNVTLTLQLFEITPDLLSYKRYTFPVAAAQIIQGVSAEGRNLRFTSINRVRVYVNGVELISSEFDRSINDQITLTPALTGNNNIVEVLVYSDIDVLIPEAQLIPIQLNSLSSTITDDLAIRGLNCWGNVTNVTIQSINRVLSYGYNFTLLDPDKSYGVARIDAVSLLQPIPVQVAGSELMILLGQEPFATQDKELHAYLSGATLVTDEAVLAYNRSVGTGALELTVDETLLTQTYNPIILPAEVIENINEQGEAETALEVQPLRKKYILGPS